MRRAMQQKHLEQTKDGLEIDDGMIVRARISCDEDTGPQLPLLVIDGKGVT